MNIIHLAYEIQDVLMNRNQQNKIEIEEIISENKKIMPIFSCVCGTKILIVPDLVAMDKAIKNHLIEHKKITGLDLTEEILTEEILKVLISALNETWLVK